MDPESWEESLRVSVSVSFRGECVSYVYLLPICFPYFSKFSWWLWSRGEISDFSMSMGNLSQWRHNFSSKHWGYQHRLRRGQEWR